MDAIRLQRLRGLSDTGDIKIKPITVLLGQNSAGKSTFLRVFPLLKQSVESRTIGPFLWNGRLVDFGNYEDAHQKNSAEGISFGFKFRLEARKFEDLRISPYETSFYFGRNPIIEDMDLSLELEVIQDKKTETTITKQLTLKFADSKVLIIIEEGKISKLQINSLDLLTINTACKFKQINFLPLIDYEKYFYFIRLKLLEEIDKIGHESISQATLINIINILLNLLKIDESQKMLVGIKSNTSDGKYWEKQMQNLTIESPEFQILRDLIIAHKLPLILQLCDIILTDFSQNISYMGPVRATAERYYRTQDLAVDEVDYQGQNLPMFLRNLTEQELKNFQTWTLTNFGFEPLIKPSRGLISIEIRPDNSKESFNVADTGFGFSQILPIITQLWFLSEFVNKEPTSRSIRPYLSPLIFAIEQPELHLHPRLQGILTDVLVTSINAAKKRNLNLSLVIETHSEVLVNRLGHLIAEKRISPEDVNIVLFEKCQESNQATVRTTQFDSEGYLIDWPLGFFDVEIV